MERLELAVRLLCESDLADGGQALLDAWPDLRDLLEPMLRERAAEAGGEETGGVPRRLGDFELVRELGRGGMGVVWVARQPALGRQVALKVLGAHLTLSPQSIARFKREAATAARLEHPAIVRVLTVGEQDGHHFFAMELIEGAPLDRVLARLRAGSARDLDGAALAEAIAQECSCADRMEARTPTPSSTFARSYVAAVADIVAQVAGALAHAHAAGVLHRDVKPSNILVRSDGSAVLTDFGLARVAELPTLTAAGAFGGTPHYVAPEQATGRSADARSEVFSLGVTLYELLALRRPFDGDSTPAILRRIDAWHPPDPHSVHAFIPADISAIVMKAIEKDPHRRYQTAADLAADLGAFLAHRPVSARLPTRLGRLVRLVRREPLRAAFGVAVASLLGLTLYVVIQQATIAAGVEKLRSEKLEELVAQGLLDVFDNQRTAIDRFLEALRVQPDHLEASFGYMVALSKLGRDWRSWHASRPASFREHPAVVRWVEVKEKGPRAELPEPSEPLDTALAAQLQLREAERMQDAQGYQRGFLLAQRAVVAAKSARLYYHALLAAAAFHAGDEPQCRATAEALVRLWPDSSLACSRAASALSRFDPDRALALAQRAVQLDPTNFKAHTEIGWELSWSAAGSRKRSARCAARSR
jgi:serine/threonine protein kinase